MSIDEIPPNGPDYRVLAAAYIEIDEHGKRAVPVRGYETSDSKGWVDPDPWLNQLPSPEHGEAWTHARDQFEAYREHGKRERERRHAEVLDAESRRKKQLERAEKCGKAWLRLWEERIEAAHDPIDTTTRVLAGIWSDEMAGFGFYKTGHKTLDDWGTLVIRLDSGKLQPAEERLQELFLSIMQEKGPEVAGKPRRLKVGPALAAKAWTDVRVAADGIRGETFSADDAIAAAEEAEGREHDYTQGEYAASRRAPTGYVLPPVWTDAAIIRSIGHTELALTPTPPPLIDGLLGADEVTLVIGQFGTYKSFTLLGWAVAIASGTPWSGHGVPNVVPVLYVATEALSGQERRLTAYCAAHDMEKPDTLRWYNRRLNLGDADTVDELIAEAKRMGAGLVIIDTLHKAATGVDTNGDGGAGIAMNALDRIRSEASVAVAVAHHTGYSGEHARGSSALEDDADVVWLIEKRGGQNGGAIRRVLTQRKNRDGELAGERDLTFIRETTTQPRPSGYVQLVLVDEWSADEINARLDELDMPNNITERKSIAELGPDVPIRRIRVALKERKERATE